MAKKFVSAITDMEEDFSQWYTDVVLEADLISHSSVRGSMVIKPYGYGIWELIQGQLDQRFKDTGHENVYMPLLIPESLLQKEKDHIEGFAPEVAWVTHGGESKLAERLCVRPTSEALFCEHYSNEIESHRDLPKLYNQWCSVVRWEKTTRPFLRSLEFLWQEGHTAHATGEEAQEETLRMLNVYDEFCENVLAIPVIKGEKTPRERFAGANRTYTIESLMHDGKALQSGTSHNFGTVFAKAFDIQYTDKNNKLQYVHQTSWGVTTRLIGALIMVHGDNRGLVMPPAVAPVEVMIIPIAQHRDGVLEKADEIKDQLKDIARVKIDDSDRSPGWKFSEHEMKGVPVRVEIGPRDIEADQAVLARRDTGEKITVALEDLKEEVQSLLKKIQKDMLEKARVHREENTFTATNMEEFKNTLDETPGFIKAMWCGEEACEEFVQEETGATSRCIPFDQEEISETCFCCDKPAKEMVYWARAY